MKKLISSLSINVMIASLLMCGCSKGISNQDSAKTKTTTEVTTEVATEAAVSTAEAVTETTTEVSVEVTTEAATEDEVSVDSDNDYLYEGNDYQVNVYSRPNTDAYKALDGKIEILPGTSDAETTVRFTSSVDDIRISLEFGEWIDEYFYFHPLAEVFQISAKKGMVYEFPAYLGETIPYYRLKIQTASSYQYWYLSMDGRGDDEFDGHYEIMYEENEDLCPLEDEPIMDLCKAYAGMMITTNGDDAIMSNYVWKTVCNAIFLNAIHYSGDELVSEVPVAEWLMYDYIFAMYPFNDNIPDFDDTDPVTYNPEEYERYRVNGGLYFNDSDTRIQDVWIDGSGTVNVDVTVVTQSGEMGVIVYLRPAADFNMDNPFGYIIVGAVISKG